MKISIKNAKGKTVKVHKKEADYASIANAMKSEKLKQQHLRIKYLNGSF